MLKLVAYITLALSANYVLAEHLNCEGKVNTFIVKGCNSEYTMCSSNGAFNYNCPSGLRFDWRRRRCDYASAIPECKLERKFRNQIFESPSEVTCEGRKLNVNFEHPNVPCDNTYYTCIEGNNLIKQNCPWEQYYDAKNDRCDYKENVKSCKRRRMKISGYADLPESELQQDTVVSDVGSPAPPPTSESNAVEIPISKITGAPDCETAENGVYRDNAEKCAAHFWKCANNKLFKYRCQENLFYDAEVNKCLHKEDIPDCGGVRKVTEAPPAFDQAVVDFDCTDKEDNYYVKEECPTEFYHCNGGVATITKCDSGLVYDQRIKACDYPEACKNDRPVSDPPSLYNHGSIKDQPKKAEFKIKFDCSSKKDGMYELKKCTKNFIQCSAGKPYRESCVEGLVFNSNTGNCDYLENCLSPPATTIAPAADEPEQTILPYSVPVPKKVKPVATTTTTTAPTTQKPARAPYTMPKKTAPAAQEPEKPALIGISCTNLANGPTALDICSADYVECWDGVGTAQKCSGGLIFNTYLGQCDFKDNVPGCNPDKKFSAPVKTSAAPTTAAPVRIPAKKDNFCKNKPDGFHGINCNSFFYQCLNGSANKLLCPSGLFYNVENQICDYKEKIVACGAKPEPTTEKTPVDEAADIVLPPYGVPAASNPEPITTSAPAPAVVPSRRPIFDCTAKKDGLYALPTCTDVFVQCHDGKTYERECQQGLFYNDVNGMCDYKEHVPACGGRLPNQGPVAPATTAAPVAQAEPAAPAYSAPVVAAPAQTAYAAPVAPVSPTVPSTVAPAVHPALSCTGKADGYYSAGCSMEYFSCTEGTLQKLGCPPSLRFSQESGRCEYAEFVSECGGSAPTTAAPAPVPVITTVAPVPVEIGSAQPQGPYQPMSKPAPVPTADSCIGQADGFYSQGCSQNYFSCLNGVTIKLECQENLRFSQALSRCEFPTFVEECGGKSTVVAQAPVSQIKPKSAKQIKLFSCTGKEDGFYSNGCASVYASCHAGRTSILKCPEQLKFAQDQSRCDVAERVPECGGSAPVVTPAPAQSAPVQSKHSCSGKADGYYSVGCSDEYINCRSGVASTMMCPAHLRFSKEANFCDYPNAVPECGGMKTKPVPLILPAPVPAVPHFDCSNKADGYYAIAPCTSQYAACMGGRTTIGRCPSTLKYNSLNGKCEFESMVLACAKPVIASAPSAPVVAPAPQTQEFSCIGRQQGIYPLGDCSDEYMVCSAYATTKNKCSSGLVMNPVTGYCDMPQRVNTCNQQAAAPVAPTHGFSCFGRLDGHYAASTCSAMYFRCVENNSYQYTCGTGLVFDQAQGVCNYPANVQGC